MRFSPEDWLETARRESVTHAFLVPTMLARIVHVMEAESEDEIRSTLARDPWSETHLRIAAIEPWTIRLDARRRA